MKSDAPRSGDEMNGGVPSPPGQGARSGRWGFGLATLILLIAAVASWVAYARQRENIRRIAISLDGLRSVARELVVEDPSQYAVVRMLELSMEDFRWQVHLPAGRRYTLQLAVAEIDEENYPPLAGSAELSPGRHSIELRYDQPAEGQWQVVVLVDGERAIQATPPVSWSPNGSSTGGASFEKNTQQPLDEPLELFRRRFHGPAVGGNSMAAGPVDGVLLYLEASG